MISHKYKCIFIHLGRTGGTSIEFAFGKTIIGPEKHWPPKIMKIKYKDYWDEYYKFTVIRNPYDWVVSRYFHNKQINYEWYEKTFNIDIRQLSFLDFLKTLKSSKINYYLGDLNEIDYIIKFEELQKGFDFVCNQIGKPRKLLEKKEHTIHEPYKNYYGKDEIEIVNEKFRGWYETFGYEKC